MSVARSLWVDYAKGIGIILVVYGHVARGVFFAGLNFDRGVFESVDSVIYSFHMPLFFFLSGLFLLASMAKRDSISLLRGKVDTILYPYVVWSLLQAIVQVVLSHYTNEHTEMSNVFSFAWLPTAQFWFLYVLFFVFALALVVYRWSDYVWCAYIFIGSVFLYFFGGQLQGGYLIGMLSHCFVYFAFGVLASFLFHKFDGVTTTGWLILIFTLFIVSQWLFHVEMSLRFGISVRAGMLLLGLIGISFVVFLSKWLMQFDLRWLAYLGRNSMTIYLVHILAGSGCRIILQKALGINDVGIHLLVGTLGGLLLPLLFNIGCARFGLEALFNPPKSLSIGKLD